MMRADYCGDGVSNTQNGTLVDLFDNRGFNVPTPNMPDFTIEAVFNRHGASAMRHERYPFSSGGILSNNACAVFFATDSLLQSLAQSNSGPRIAVASDVTAWPKVP